MADANAKFEKGGENDITGGPLKARRCTDILCVLLFLASWAAYTFVTVLGMSEGNPSKLFKPRDFKGGFCGLEGKWNNGNDYKNQEKLTFTMNVTSTLEMTSKQLVCSGAAESAIRGIWTGAANKDKLDNYLCACCKTPCRSCQGSLDLGGNLANPAAVSSTIGGKMGEFSNPGGGALFSPGSANGNLFGDVWKETTKYFVQTCTKSCGDTKTDGSRTYTYSPFPDDPLFAAWKLLETDTNVDVAIRNTIKNSFTLQALPKSVCPYNPQYCVPFPGVKFNEIPGGQCMFELNAAAVEAVGGAAAGAYKSLGMQNVADNAQETAGNWAGDFLDSIDAFIIVAVCSFAVGFVFLVLLRFFVGVVVWSSIFLVFFLFLIGGALCYVRHSQCAGVGLLESGHQMGGTLTTAAKSGVNNAVTGSEANEAMTGVGEDYRGVQTKTRSGKTCQAWGVQTPQSHSYTTAAYPKAGLEKNYCRNPSGTAASIWCYTTDKDKVWDLCTPIGVINAKCTQGYEVQDENMRKFMEILAYIIFGLAGVWVITICCLCKQIRLAVKLNKVAAVFVYNTPTVLLVPMCQALVGILWCVAWAASATFLLSQVPKDHVPSGFFQTYAEAYGTSDTEGKCTAAYVNGFVYKYSGDLSSANDPCSGNKGDTSSITPKCWGCYPPRYVIDWRFAVSFFSFLWNNAFLIALGQLIIAGAVGVWFFTPTEEKRQVKSVRFGTWIAFRYHLGSIAFGSFIVAVVQFIRYAMMYFEQQAKAAKNRIAALLLKIAQCCMWCLEKCIKFLNKNAYIQIALVGKGFCASAKAAFWLIFRNMARFGAVAMLGSIIQYIGMLFIIAGTCTVGYFILKALHPKITPVLPMVIYFLTSYVVAKLYMNVFQLSVDTMLQCFIATEEMGGDSGFVPGPLKDLVKDNTGGAKKEEEAKPEEPQQGGDDNVTM